MQYPLFCQLLLADLCVNTGHEEGKEDSNGMEMSVKRVGMVVEEDDALDKCKVEVKMEASSELHTVTPLIPISLETQHSGTQVTSQQYNTAPFVDFSVSKYHSR